MYSFEIRQYLQDRDYKLTSDEFTFLSSIEGSCQITNVKFMGDYRFSIRTSDKQPDDYFEFEVKPYVKVLK